MLVLGSFRPNPAPKALHGNQLTSYFSEPATIVKTSRKKSQVWDYYELDEILSTCGRKILSK